MDPNANLAEQNAIVVNLHRSDLTIATMRQQRRRLAELREALIDWLRGDGFAPSWDLYPHASAYFYGSGIAHHIR